jgi:hypothetical protein
LAIVTLVLWVATAAAGVSLLSTGGAARRAAAAARSASERAAADQADQVSEMAGAGGGTAPAATPAATAHTIAMARSKAVPLTAEGKPPPVPRVRVETPPGEHPLLEFSHPALAVVGLACWMMFTFVHYHPLAWISFGILVVTISLGLTWLTRNAQAVAQHARAAWQFPSKLVLAHGLGAAIAIALTVLTALTASRS